MNMIGNMIRKVIKEEIEKAKAEEEKKKEKEMDKDGAVADLLSANQSILVQVVKEPISTKGPRLSCELSLAGRYLILVPFANGISISKKIFKSYIF